MAHYASRNYGGSGSSSNPFNGRNLRRNASETDEPKTARCSHYARYCNLVAPCCGEIVCCHRGHDALHNHNIALLQVREVICCNCKHRQPVANACRNCPQSFGEKGCITCRMWYAGDGFHCSDCGVCRRGRVSEMTHCATCKMCYPVRSGSYSHVCAINAMERPCPLCGQDMFRSRKPSTTMQCGHAMHCECFLNWVKTNYYCPIRHCRKTVGNMAKWNKALDSQHAKRQQQSRFVKIYCRDCNSTTTSAAGGKLKKCKVAQCGSYNTVQERNAE